jgi:hypothetical protein
LALQDRIIRETVRDTEKHFRDVVVKTLTLPSGSSRDDRKPGPADPPTVLWEQVRVLFEQRLQQVFQDNQTNLATAYIANWKVYNIVPPGVPPQDAVCHCAKHDPGVALPRPDCVTPEQARAIFTAVLRESGNRPPSEVGPEKPLRVDLSPVRQAVEDLQRRMEREFGEVIKRLATPARESQPTRDVKPPGADRTSADAAGRFQDQLDGERRDRTSQTAALTRTLEDLRGMLNGYHAKADGTSKQVAALGDRVKKVEGDLSQAVAKVDKIGPEFARTGDRLNRFDVWRVGVENSTSWAHNEILKYSEQLADLRPRVDGAGNAVAMANAKIDRLEQWTNMAGREISLHKDQIAALLRLLQMLEGPRRGMDEVPVAPNAPGLMQPIPNAPFNNPFPAPIPPRVPNRGRMGRAGPPG